jgi:NitT/TauT family transport system substrate-binding protein
VLTLSIAHAKGVAATLVAPGAGYHSATPSARLLVSGDSTIRSVKDLEGKTIAIPVLGDINSIAVEGTLDQGGVDRSKVQFVEIPPPAMPTALLAKRVDAIAAYEPFVSSALDQGARAIAKQYDSIARDFVAAWVGSDPWIAAHRTTVVTFATVFNRASQYANVHHDELIPLTASFTKLPPEVLGKLPYPTVAPTLDLGLIQPVIDAAAKYHAIPASFRAKEFVFDAT